MKITVRPTQESDVAFARETHHLAYQEAVVRQFGSWEETRQDDFFARGWAAAKHEILIKDGAPCGYVGVDMLPHYISVRELVIHPRFQHQGVGSTFLKQLMTKAQELGVPIKLGTFKTNKALVLYHRLGFKDYGQTETHILLEWKGRK